MSRTLLLAFALVAALASAVVAEDTVRNYGSTDVTPAAQSAAAVDPTLVAFGHRRRGCSGGDCLSPATFDAYSTYQPNPYGGGYYPGTVGYRGAFGPNAYGNYGGGYAYMTPNPYGYYQNGWIWGSSGPTYQRPFPVWNSPSGIYDYRYLGWGSYGWGGWGGTGPAGWGYQGGFYW